MILSELSAHRSVFCLDDDFRSRIFNLNGILWAF